jgi:hypothetical protein
MTGIETQSALPQRPPLPRSKSIDIRPRDYDSSRGRPPFDEDFTNDYFNHPSPAAASRPPPIAPITRTPSMGDDNTAFRKSRSIGSALGNGSNSWGRDRSTGPPSPRQGPGRGERGRKPRESGDFGTRRVDDHKGGQHRAEPTVATGWFVGPRKQQPDSSRPSSEKN